jgi:tetratricopeptide (TPR) repeat protein
MALVALVTLLLAGGAQGVAQPACSPEAACVEDLAASQLFELAESHAAAGDARQAEIILRDLARHPTLQVRSEARFRLAVLLAKSGRVTAAALLLRQILDENPDASRVRLELARLLERIGDDAGARKALREAQAGGLPPEVALLVDRYSAALRARKATGASLEVAIAPDSNINRATRSASLGTIFGDLELDRDARETSGVGLALRGQAYWRARLGPRANMLAKIAGSADLYRERQFNDVAAGVSAGPELAIGAARLGAELGAISRWRGHEPFSRTFYVGANVLRPLDRRSQLRASGAVGTINNQLSNLQDGRSYGLSVSYERALSARAGVGISLFAERQDLRDDGYSTKSAQLSVFGYREIASATLTATLSYMRLEADERLFLYPRRRKEDLYRASFAATFRKLAVASFAPLVRVTAERNRSSLGLFDYRRIRTELGIVRAF